MQVEYGILIALVALQRLPQRYCIIQKLEPVSLNDEQIVNDFDCPVLSLLNDFYAISPDCVLTPVSVVHQCTHTCVFLEKLSSSNIERESIATGHSIVFEHDWSNSMYCLNVFCMNQ